MKDTAARNKILEATINSIEIYGIEGCTIRNIAKEAGVTLSSVHYYFESKEVLVEKALELAITGSFEDIENIWKDCGKDYQSAINRILAYLLEGAIKYPGVTRAGLQPLLMQGKTDGLFNVKLNEFLEKASAKMAGSSGESAETLKLRLIQAFSAVLFNGISPDAFQEFSSMSFHQEKNRKLLIDSVIKTYF